MTKEMEGVWPETDSGRSARTSLLGNETDGSINSNGDPGKIRW